MKNKIKVLIDYPVEKFYNGQTFPGLLYSELKNDSRFEIFLPNKNKNFKDLDVMIIFAGGNHYKFFDDIFSSILSEELKKKFLLKFSKYIIWIGYFLSLKNLGYYGRLLIPNTAYQKRIEKIKKKHKDIKIIHRLDGMYKIICKNYGVDKTVKELNKLSDVTVHQSNYSQKIWNEEIKTIFGEKTNLESKKEILINNGVDTDFFKPEGEIIKLKGKWKILNVTASSNPNKNLLSVLEIANLLKDNEDFQFYFIGEQINDPICGKDIKKFNNCHYIGKINNREEIAKYYRSCDIFLFPALNDCSPNVILEAMSSGLPVITSNSGGNLELIIKDEFQGGIVLNDKNPILAIKTITENYDKFKSESLKIVKKYHDIKIVINNYKTQILNLVS